MKNITIAGRLTKDAEQRTTSGGDKVLAFSVAVDDRSGKDKPTMFFDVNLWGARWEKVAQYLTKGTAVSVSGDLSRREHNERTYLDVRGDQLTLLGGKSESRTGGGGNEGFSGQAGKADKREHHDLSDDIPFIVW